MAAAAPSHHFWTLFHSLLRPGKSTDAEQAVRATENCAWMVAELGLLRKCTTPQEAGLLEIIYEQWGAYGVAPSFDIVSHLMEANKDPEMEEAFEEYKTLRSDKALTFMEDADLRSLVGEIQANHRRHKLETLLKGATAINSTGANVTTGGKDKEFMKGPDDAMRYLFTRLDSGIVGSGSDRVTHATVQHSGAILEEVYEQNVAEQSSSQGRNIPTGLNTLDSQVHLRRKQFFGILGFAGQGKSRLGRTICYHAAKAGFNVLHLTLEQSTDEELLRYLIRHSYEPKFPQLKLSVEKFDNGTLTQYERDFLFKEVYPEMKNDLPGLIRVREPDQGTNWDGFKSTLNMEHKQRPVDLFYMDYLAMVRTKSLRNAREEREEIIEDAKSLALTFDDSRGLLVGTPVQGSRHGYDQAKKNGGVWDMSGVYMYSMFDKALDNCFAIYGDADLELEGCILASTAKHRRGKTITPVKLAANNECGMLFDFKSGGQISDATIEQAMEDM